jgi:1,4-alpha-glucan branching enzyme
MDEEWLLEATAETYIPLLNTFHRLIDEGISPKVTIGISPVLAEQLKHPYFARIYKEYCLSKIEFAQNNALEFDTADKHHLVYLAKLWEEFYSKSLADFENRYRGDLISEFKALQDQGQIEIITCGATHAYLPALREDTSVQAQIKMAVKSYRRMFERSPRGIWLPECGYRPSSVWRAPFAEPDWAKGIRRKGVEEFLSENNLGFFIVDHHQLMKAYPADLYKKSWEAYKVGSRSYHQKPVSVLSRDIELSMQVWRHQIGYPGDGIYMDFHKKHEPGKLRYWKITHTELDMAYKHFYYPEDAYFHRIQQHAGHYKSLIKESLIRKLHNADKTPFVLTAFDSELFGHWWFEGPTWLYHLIKWINTDPNLSTVTVSEYLEKNPAYNWVNLPESSWGANFDNSTWINPHVAWVWERVYQAEREIQAIARKMAGRTDAPLLRIGRQLIRELMLLQSSDWEFMITNDSTKDHAEARVLFHHEDFKRLAKMAWDYLFGVPIATSDWDMLTHRETINSLFPDPEMEWYRTLDYPIR